MSSPSGTQPAQTGARSPYIAGPVYDWALFLLPPVIALGLGILISGTWITHHKFFLAGKRLTPASLFLGVLINAHLVAVFFRSHGNPSLFRLYPLRFIAAPILLYAAMMTSIWALIGVTVLAIFWDVYHSALQTFGLARIYDRNHGNDPAVGRRLDFALNQLLYVGPIVAGATMIVHFKKFELFEEAGTTFFNAIPVFMKTNQKYFSWSVIAAGTFFIAYYIFAYWRLYKRGYKVSALKVYLLASTGVCSIYTWGFNSWGEAFFVMNVFHAVQYLGLVWWSERGHIRRRLRLEGARIGAAIALTLFLVSSLAYGYWAEMVTAEEQSLWCVTQVVAIMHFWYDGFIWSVRKKQI
jgi:hypothetical protein